MVRQSSGLLWFAACLCLTGSQLDAQMLGREAAPKLVKLSVVAMDAHGQPVGDLAAGEFQITDAGKAQKVAVFRHSDSKLQQAAPLRPGEYSNRAAANVPHATLILFDLLNDSLGARGTAQNVLVHALQSLESGDNLFLYLLTQDAHLAAVRGLPGSEGEPPDSGGVPWSKDSKALMDQAVSKVYRLRPIDMDIDARVRLTYRALEGVASLLGGIPGRKNIVWITHGVPISLGPNITITGDSVDYTPLLRRLCVTMERTSVAIYPIQQVPPGMAMQGDPEAQFSGMGSQDTLQQFADLTGGPTKSTGDIGVVIRQAMNDVRTSYELGYYPASENWDSKFHKLRVTCMRKGVRLQVKTGYYAFTDPVNDEQLALDTALASPFDAAEIGLRGTRSPAAGGGGGTHFELRIDPADVRIAQAGDRYTGHLALQIAGYSGDGQNERSKVIPLDLSLTADERAKVLKEGIVFAQDIAMGAGIARVRFVVFDREAHGVGTLTIPVQAAGK